MQCIVRRQADPLDVDSEDGKQQLLELRKQLQRYEINVGGLRQLSRVSADKAVAEGKESNSAFWSEGRLFIEIFEALIASLRLPEVRCFGHSRSDLTNIIMTSQDIGG